MDFFGSNKTYTYANKGVFLITMKEVSNERFLPVYAFVVVVVVVVLIVVVITNDLTGFFSLSAIAVLMLSYTTLYRCHSCCH